MQAIGDHDEEALAKLVEERNACKKPPAAKKPKSRPRISPA